MPLAGGPAELEGGVYSVLRQAQALPQALHEVGVPAAELGHWQNAQLQLTPEAPAQG